MQRGGRRPTTGTFDHVREGERPEVLAHVLSDLRPDRQKDALALVLASSVLVWPAEVPCDDGPVDRAHDLAQGDLTGRTGEDVTAPDATLGSHEPCPLERQQYLLQVRLRETRPLGDVAHRSGAAVVCVQGQGEKSTTGVIPAGGDLHDLMLPAPGVTQLEGR